MVVAWLMVGRAKPLRWMRWARGRLSLVYFFVGALAIAFLGAGRYAIGGNSAWR
jgi:putative oxidoreductase